jgi:flagellar FliJ protein
VKRFSFRFQRVLETKRHFEQMRKDELAALMAQRLEDERKLFAVQETLLERQRELSDQAEARETLPDLMRVTRYFGKLAKDIGRFERQLAQWDERIEAKRDELVEAKREVRVLEKLEEKDRRAYAKALGDWERKLIDDVATGRYVRAARDEGGQREEGAVPERVER